MQQTAEHGVLAAVAFHCSEPTCCSTCLIWTLWLFLLASLLVDAMGEDATAVGLLGPPPSCLSPGELLHVPSLAAVVEREDKGVEAALGRGWELTGDWVRAWVGGWVGGRSASRSLQ
jgi:hypothetical protein